jgi:hypothetical protein
MEPKAALMLLQNERNAATNTTSVSAPTQSHSAAEAKRRSEEGSGEGGSHKGDWLMSMRPNLTFPPFPGVTEDMGVLAQEYLQHFCCPFIKKQGITYANAGFEAVAPVTAEVTPRQFPLTSDNPPSLPFAALHCPSLSPDALTCRPLTSTSLHLLKTSRPLETASLDCCSAAHCCTTLQVLLPVREHQSDRVLIRSLAG